MLRLGWGPGGPARSLGIKDAALGRALPQWLLPRWVWGHWLFHSVSSSGFPGRRLPQPRGDTSLGLGSGNPFDYKFIARLIFPAARPRFRFLRSLLFSWQPAEIRHLLGLLPCQLISCLHLTLLLPCAFPRGTGLRFSLWPSSREWVCACSYSITRTLSSCCSKRDGFRCNVLASLPEGCEGSEQHPALVCAMELALEQRHSSSPCPAVAVCFRPIM